VSARRGRAGLEPWAYVTPTVVLIVVVMLVPLCVGVSYAFRNIQILNPFSGGWAGTANFEQLWRDRNFWRAMTNTVWWTFGSVAVQLVLGLGLAMLLRDAFPGRKLVQSLVFLPWAVPTFLIGLDFAWLFNPVIGPFPHWLHAAGLLAEPRNILADPALAMAGPVLANVWYGVPFFAITLLAALQSIPADLYEAAAVDGATTRQRFLKITLPFLAPVIAITVMLRTIWIANFADLIVVMTGGGPADSTQIVASYIFTQAYRRLDFGYASAVALVLLVLMMLYALAILSLRRALPRTT
jgi:multiple sugar transport system permease protein